jgi:hypothetical protein
MKYILLITISSIFISCNEIANSKHSKKGNLKAIKDTVIMKYEHLSQSGVSKMHSYLWVVGKDTLDLRLVIEEFERDSSLNLSILHKEPLLFSTVLKKINASFYLINHDYDLLDLRTVSFRSPIYYPDLAKSLSTQYEQSFGQEMVKYDKLNKFLLGTEMNSQLNTLLKPFNKKVKLYSVEKFNLVNKKHYGFAKLPNFNFSNYPEFTLDGIFYTAELTSN